MTEKEKNQKELKTLSGIVSELRYLVRDIYDRRPKLPTFISVSDILDAAGESIKECIGGTICIVIKNSEICQVDDDSIYSDVASYFFAHKWKLLKRSDFDSEPDYPKMYRIICDAIGKATGDRAYFKMMDSTGERQPDLTGEEKQTVIEMQVNGYSRAEADEYISKKRGISVEAAHNVLKRYNMLKFKEEISDKKLPINQGTPDLANSTIKINPFDLFNI